MRPLRFLFVERYSFTEISIFPVEVVILQTPPLSKSGTLTFPVLVFVINCFGVRRVPFTEPVSVSMWICEPSHSSSVTSPVSVVMEILFDDITLVSFISPVSATAQRFAQD